ncbi:HAD-IIB family hydrolase [Candidatus Kaiserbacteria bacterium]|nr:HAD-IIB family hydrolase [Candidatus Kaiserbacteria bacterium]
MSSPRAVVFDLDNTLALAFEHLSARTAKGLSQLLELIPVAVMSGATIERMEEYVLPTLPSDAKLANLYLFPNTGASCYVWKKGEWQRAYHHAFTREEFDAAVAAVSEGIEKTGIVEGAPQWGERIVARENQITFAGIGVDAPADKKRAWDPDRAKRAKLKAFLDEKLAGFDFDIRVSSRTAIDITKTGINKALGVRWLAKHLGVEPKDMLFVGDDLKPHGNDAVVIPTGIQIRETSGPEETAAIIEELIGASDPT